MCCLHSPIFKTDLRFIFSLVDGAIEAIHFLTLGYYYFYLIMFRELVDIIS